MKDPRKAWNRGATLDQIARNPDDTYNGVAALSALSGLDPCEIRWTFDRLKQLMAGGHDKDAAKRIVANEAKSKPWVNTSAE